MGYVKIPREIFEDPALVSVKLPRPWAMIDLIQMARYKDGQEFVNGRYVSLRRGQLCKSIRALATRWKWDEKTVSRFLVDLEKSGFIVYPFPRSKGGLTRIISINNYDCFSEDSYTDSDSDSYTDSHTNSHAGNIEIKENKKTKENNTSNEAASSKRFVRPTAEEVAAYCDQNNYLIDAQSFVDYYESKGWKVGNSPMKSWQAAVRTWVRRRKEEGGLFNTSPQPEPQPAPAPVRQLTYQDYLRDNPIMFGESEEEYQYRLKVQERNMRNEGRWKYGK